MIRLRKYDLFMRVIITFCGKYRLYYERNEINFLFLIVCAQNDIHNTNEITDRKFRHVYREKDFSSSPAGR